ncbi:sulfurtransferase TusA family protein [Sinobaca sp. H24]|uniref:sulfurtransferase TusA family protein n=1 Tax=Sinobaca sp. H24 TaxID=2923376 RepID=UPI002079BBC8|nr:sulfurtransferase TusA family protein [Sinobaca sp. H24]
MNVTKTVDAKGLSCPMPVVKAKKAMDSLETGDVLEIVSTDKGAKADLPAWTKSSGHALLEQTEASNEYTFWIRKG